MIEPELCFAGLEELFTLIEGYIKFSIDYCFKNVRDDLEYFNKVHKMNVKQAKKKNQGKQYDGFEDLI